MFLTKLIFRKSLTAVKSNLKTPQQFLCQGKTPINKPARLASSSQCLLQFKSITTQIAHNLKMNCPECGTPFNVDEHCPYCYGIWLNKEINRSKRKVYRIISKEVHK